MIQKAVFKKTAIFAMQIYSLSIRLTSRSYIFICTIFLYPYIKISDYEETFISFLKHLLSLHCVKIRTILRKM